MFSPFYELNLKEGSACEEYPGPEAVREFTERLKEYKTSKGTIQLPYSRPVPAELISDIARWCHETGNHP